MIHCPPDARRHEHCVSRCPIAVALRDRNRRIFASVSVRRGMTNWPVSQKIRGTGHVGRPVERTVRLATGLILFSYATSHFINHAFGIRSIDAMQAASVVLLHPWQTNLGRLLLYTSLLVHAALGLYAVYRRRHLRIPPSEAWQLALGLAIPLVLIPHAAAIAIGE